MFMKKFFFYMFAAVSAFAFFSCDPAESSFTQTVYVYDIYTVNKHTVRPEFEDTAFMVQNMAQYPLQTGDRAYMVLKYFYDAESVKYPQWTIEKVLDIIPTRPLQTKDSVAFEGFTTPFVTLDYFEVHDRYYNPVWVRNNLQNINITYNGIADGAEFAMLVRGVVDNYVELELLAKAKTIGAVKTTKLLTFDLSKLGDFLTAEQKRTLSGVDSLYTRIYFRRAVKDSIYEANIIGGSLANPFKK